jgi:hypothetical protein
VDPREPLPISLAKAIIEAMSMPSYVTLPERSSPIFCRQAPYYFREPAVWALSVNEEIRE